MITPATLSVRHSRRMRRRILVSMLEKSTGIQTEAPSVFACRLTLTRKSNASISRLEKDPRIVRQSANEPLFLAPAFVIVPSGSRGKQETTSAR